MVTSTDTRTLCTHACTRLLRGRPPPAAGALLMAGTRCSLTLSSTSHLVVAGEFDRGSSQEKVQVLKIAKV